MKVAYLLVTTAWFAGADVVPVSHGSQGTAPVASVSGCGSGCNNNSCAQEACCEESWGHKFKQKLRGLFQRDNDCCGQTTGHHHHAVAQTTSGCCNAAPATTGCCAPAAQSCDTCGNEGYGRKLFGKLKGLFHRSSNDCCDPCASGTAGAPIQYGAPVVTPKTGEPLPPPKDMPNKMPNAKDPPPPVKDNPPIKTAPPKGALLEAPGEIAPAQLAPPAPALQPAPAITPAIPADLNNGNKERSPF